MAIPARDDIDDMVELIGGPDASFDRLSIPDRMRIVELVNQSDAAEALERISQKLDDIEKDTIVIADWFRNSKVYYP